MKLLLTLCIVLHLCCALGYSASVLRDAAQSLQMALEKDIMQHTLRYLKHRLVRCLKENNALRTKRMTETSYYFKDLEDQIAFDIMQHTRSYLVSRLVECQEEQISMRGKNEEFSREEVEVVTVATKSHAEGVTRGDQSDQDKNWKTFSKKETPTTTKSPNLVVYNIDGRRVSCAEMKYLHNRTALECRDLRIDHIFRLPNKDVCFPTRHPDNWKPLRTIGSTTFEVFDIENFCYSLAEAAGIFGIIDDANVIWDCDESQERLVWQNNQWAGKVVDNGYLKDLQCFFVHVDHSYNSLYNTT